MQTSNAKSMKKVLGIAALITVFSVSSAINPPFKTTLILTVRDELGNLVEGASVKLFEKQEDYQKEINAAAEATTDEKGIVRFKGLRPVAYFVLVRKGDKDNSGGGEQI